MNLAAASALWSVRENLSILIGTVNHPPLRVFSNSCHSFLKRLDVDLREDPFWRRACSTIKRIRFDLAANPVPLRRASPDSAALLEKLRKGMEYRLRLYPEAIDSALELVALAESLVLSDDAPILEYLFTEDLLKPPLGGNVALVVCEPRYLTRLREELCRFGLESVVALAPPRLKEPSLYSRLILIGPTSWFPDHVLASPKAEQLVFVHLDWLGPNRPPRSVRGDNSPGSWNRSGLPEPLKIPSEQGPAADTAIEILDIVPSIDWEMLLEDVGSIREESGADSHDRVPARLCTLEGGWSTFLRAHEEARSYVLTFHQGQADVHEERTDTLESGDFILLRTRGGGDYVVDLAWEFLGEKADTIMRAQVNWKVALRRKIDQHGLCPVSANITARGASAASPSNVRAWASDDRIQPGRKEDFQAVLEFLELGDHAEDYWRLGRAIIRARIRAGHHIRRLLLAEVAECDPFKLEEDGRVDFKLKGEGSGSLTAWRVRDLSPSSVEVPSHRIGTPFRLEPGLWPE
jgi:hypothetical protein